MVKAFGKASGNPVKYEIGPRRPGDVQDSWANADKAKEVLGWEAKRGIDEICRDAWKWQSSNPNGYDE
jgi:UDP-glucose 4-epimerase